MPDAYSCPKGHRSSEADFCSECGAKIAAPAGAADGPAPASALCPDCQAPRAHDGGDFCEVCGYNFSSGAHGDVAFAQAAAISTGSAAISTGSAAASPPATPQTASTPKWSIFAAIDPSLREDGSPEPPASTGPYTFAIDKPENLIGRHSRARGIEPEIALDFDDAVSHRHAIITRHDDGSLTMRDVGSSNGTRLNGSDVAPLTDAPLHDGDQVTLGHWTRLTVKAGE